MMRSPPAARPCATTPRRKGGPAPSSIASTSMTGRASLARGPAAAAPLGGSSRRGVRLFIVASASDELRRIGMGYETIIVDNRDAVGVVTLNRPAVLKALGSRGSAEFSG